MSLSQTSTNVCFHERLPNCFWKREDDFTERGESVQHRRAKSRDDKSVGSFNFQQCLWV